MLGLELNDGQLLRHERGTKRKGKAKGQFMRRYAYR